MKMKIWIPSSVVVRGLLAVLALIFLQCTMPVQHEDTVDSFAGTEISLVPEYWAAVADEPELSEAAALRAIGRGYDIMDFSDPRPLLAYMIAVLADTVTAEIVGDIRDSLEGLGSTTERVAAIHAYTAGHMSHTQTDPAFAEIPWKDPWGMDLISQQPRYKKLLPTEMKAMTLHTGKISGKCMTLAHLVTAIFYWLGSQPDDIMIFVTQNQGYRHANSMLVYEDSLVFTNNHHLDLFSHGPGEGIPGPVHILGFYNHEKAANWDYTIVAIIDESAFAGDSSAIQTFCGKYAVPEGCFACPQALGRYHSRRALVEDIYRNRLDPELGFLVKYAAQSLYVRHPEYYLQASLRCSGPKDLAGSLENPAAVFAWIAENIRDGSIFAEAGSHLMTADQVLVFETGSAKDRAVLAYTLLKKMSLEPQLLITSSDAYVTIDEEIWSLVSGEPVARPEGRVFFQYPVE